MATSMTLHGVGPMTARERLLFAALCLVILGACVMVLRAQRDLRNVQEVPPAELHDYVVRSRPPGDLNVLVDAKGLCVGAAGVAWDPLAPYQREMRSCWLDLPMLAGAVVVVRDVR